MIGTPPVPTLAAPADRRSAGLRELIAGEVAQACARRHGSALRALVLTGSLARDEAGLVLGAGHLRVLGDAELLLVLTDATRLPDRAEAERLAGEVEEALLGRGVTCEVTLSPVHAAYLRALGPSIFAYELRTCGRVVAGQPDILDLIPAFAPSAIPQEDAWRLLCNRIVEHLEATEAPAGSYRTVKLYLDMATSLLVFAGAYQPTYRERAEALTRLAAETHEAAAFPSPLEALARQVSLCTGWKVQGGEPLPPAGLTPDDALAWAKALWRWELIRLTGASADLANRELLAAWMARQPALARYRGWLHVARRLGWTRSWRHGPRWARLARRASPRYWVYAAAGQLLFARQSPKQERDWSALLRRLPVNRLAGSPSEPIAWQRAAAEIGWNYRQFLVDTRS
jgi:hypothetical protein